LGIHEARWRLSGSATPVQMVDGRVGPFTLGAVRRVELIYADEARFINLWQRYAGSVTDWPDGAVLSHRKDDLGLCRAPDAPSLEPPPRDLGIGVVLLKVYEVVGIGVDTERVVAKVLDEWDAVQDSLASMLEQLVRRPAQGCEADADLA
jgi:hypothetical protein